MNPRIKPLVDAIANLEEALVFGVTPEQEPVVRNALHRLKEALTHETAL